MSYSSTRAHVHLIVKFYTMLHNIEALRHTSIVRRRFFRYDGDELYVTCSFSLNKTTKPAAANNQFPFSFKINT